MIPSDQLPKVFEYVYLVSADEGEPQLYLDGFVIAPNLAKATDQVRDLVTGIKGEFDPVGKVVSVRYFGYATAVD